MCTTVDERLIPERVDSFRCVAHLAILRGQVLFDRGAFRRLHVELSRAMTYLASCILEVRCLLHAQEPPRFSIARCVAEIASLDLLLRETFSHSLYAPERGRLFCICHKIHVFSFMTGPAGISTYISGDPFWNLWQGLSGIKQYTCSNGNADENEWTEAGLFHEYIVFHRLKKFNWLFRYNCVWHS